MEGKGQDLTIASSRATPLWVAVRVSRRRSQEHANEHVFPASERIFPIIKATRDVFENSCNE